MSRGAALQGHSVFNVLEATLDKLPSGRTGPKAGAHAVFFSDDLHMAGCSGSGVPGAALRQALDQQVRPRAACAPACMPAYPARRRACCPAGRRLECWPAHGRPGHPAIAWGTRAWPAAASRQAGRQGSTDSPGSPHPAVPGVGGGRGPWTAAAQGFFDSQRQWRDLEAVSFLVTSTPGEDYAPLNPRLAWRLAHMFLPDASSAYLEARCRQHSRMLHGPLRACRAHSPAHAVWSRATTCGAPVCEAGAQCWAARTLSGGVRRWRARRCTRPRPAACRRRSPRWCPSWPRPPSACWRPSTRTCACGRPRSTASPACATCTASPPCAPPPAVGSRRGGLLSRQRQSGTSSTPVLATSRPLWPTSCP